MKWTRGQDTELLDRWGAGETATQIAQVLETNRNSVLGRIHRLKAGARPAKRIHIRNDDLKPGSVPSVSPAAEVLEFERLPNGAPWPAPDGCRFITGEVSKGTYRWCNRPVETDSSWCPACAKRVWRRDHHARG